jgi:ribose 1,5-bisphosphokinase
MLKTGRFFYIVGASGAGKNTLIQYARQHHNHDTPIIFAHRYATSSAKNGNDNCVFLTDEEFNHRRKLGCFALNWENNGLQYAIGIEINQWLAKGLNVVVCGSHKIFEQAVIKYPEIRPILIKLDSEILHERLMVRGRDSLSEIDDIVKHATIFNHVRHPFLITLDNSGPIEFAGDALSHSIYTKPLSVW